MEDRTDQRPQDPEEKQPEESSQEGGWRTLSGRWMSDEEFREEVYRYSLIRESIQSRRRDPNNPHLTPEEQTLADYNLARLMRTKTEEEFEQEWKRLGVDRPNGDFFDYHG